MDLFDGQVDLDHQVHDYNPGITPSGLFWVTHVDDDTVDVNMHASRASMEVEDLEISDFGNLLHSLRGDASQPARVSYQMRWQNVLRRVNLRDKENGFEGQFLETEAFVEWTASQEGFEFESDPLETSESVFAVFGQERNGVFFR